MMRQLSVLVAAIGGSISTVPLSAHPPAGIAFLGDATIVVAGGPRDGLYVMDRNGTVTHRFVGRDGEPHIVNPHHVVAGPDGALFTMDDRGGPLWRLDPDGTIAKVIEPRDETGLGSIGRGGDPFTLDAEGGIVFVNERHGQAIQILRRGPDGRLSILFDADGSAVRLHGASFAWGRDGSLLFTDGGRHVRRLAGGRLETVASPPLEGAMGLVLDEGDGLIVGDIASHRILRIMKDGSATVLAGDGTSGQRDGPARQARFDGPAGFAIDPRDGSIVVRDAVRDSFSVRRIVSMGNAPRVETIASVAAIESAEGK